MTLPCIAGGDPQGGIARERMGNAGTATEGDDFGARVKAIHKAGPNSREAS